MLTANAAWAGFDEGETGSLEAGKSADLAILNMDPLSLPAAQLRKLKVESLILAGKPWKEGQSALSAIARALASPRRI
jgi:predicted amidohydrolase YtcJ